VTDITEGSKVDSKQPTTHASTPLTSASLNYNEATSSPSSLAQFLLFNFRRASR
jgi:hypothetical protein